MKPEFWIDTRLNSEEMDFLWTAISKENKANWNHDLAGNIFKSELIEDKDNWFYETVLKKLTEKMFYDDWNNYRKYYIVEKEHPLPEFELNPLWVNYMKQHEFNPLHTHNGLYSFVIFMKIPTYWKEQHALPFSSNSRKPLASDFVFMWSEMGEERISKQNFPLNPKDEGRILFFPAWLEHQVFPFYGTEEDRVTISGNIQKKSEKSKVGDSMAGEVDFQTYEQKEKILEMMKNGVQQIEEELKQMEKGGSI